MMKSVDTVCRGSRSEWRDEAGCGWPWCAQYAEHHWPARCLAAMTWATRLWMTKTCAQWCSLSFRT